MNIEPTSPDTLQEPVPGRSSFNRRRFLLGSGATMAAVVAAGRFAGNHGQQVGTTGSASALTAPPNPVLGQAATGDLAAARLAASVEVLAVNTYQGALDAAGAGKLGAVPPVVSEYVTTAKSQHQAHLDAWNKVISAAGEPAVTDAHPELKAQVDKDFAQVKDVIGAARLALKLERIAEATYLDALPNLVNPDAVKLAASIQAIDARHAAILLYALGEYPVPNTFAQTAMAAPPLPRGAVDGLPRTH